jgi:hypothetical protein
MTAGWAPGSDVERLRLELELAELEAGGFAYGLAAGASGEPARPFARRREVLPHEAHVDFDALEADLDLVRDRVAGVALGLRPVVLEALLTRLDDASTSPLQTLNQLQLTGFAGLPGVTDRLGHVAVRARVELEDLAARSVSRVRHELVASGMPAHLLDDPPKLSAGTVDAIAAAGVRVATAPAAQVLDAATVTATAASGPGRPTSVVQRAIVDAVAGLSDRGVADVAGQAVNRAAGLGRGDGADSLDPDALAVRGAGGHVEIYASELIDRSTCIPCALVDGTDYPTAAAAGEDYPFGQYVACLGGGRCRGMLVYVWSEEAPATIGLPR